MIKANKNLSHDKVDYVKGQHIEDEGIADVLLKLGHADKHEAEVAPKAGGKKAVKVEAPPVAPPVEPESEESFDDIEDNLPPAAPAEVKAPAAKKASAKKAASKK